MITEDKLTLKQQEFFERLKGAYGQAPLPSFDKIKERLNFRYKNSIKQYFEKLTSANLILKRENRLFINPELFGARVFSSSVRAGFTAAIEDNIEKRISLDEEFATNDPSTFIFKVSGDSMVDLGIFQDDMVIVKRAKEAKIGDVVLACVDGEYTLKTYRKDKRGVYLEPANSAYPLIFPKISLTIFGVVQGVVRKL